MAFEFNPFSAVLLFFGILTLIMALHIYSRANRVVRWFALIMAFSSIWSIGYGLELASTSVWQGVFFVKLEYLGISFLPFFWILFALDLNGMQAWYKKKRNLALLLFVPIVTLVLVWTNNYTLWYFSKVDTVYPKHVNFPVLNFYPGIGYRIMVALLYVMLITGCYLVYKSYKEAKTQRKKRQYHTIAMFAILPWLGDISYQLGFRPLEYFDSTPFLFVITTTMLYVAIYFNNMFDVIPVVREKMLDMINDGFIVLDDKHRLIDFNASMQKFIPYRLSKKNIGQYPVFIFKTYPELHQLIKEHKNSKIDLTRNNTDETYYFQADVLFLNDNNINNESVIIKFKDLSKAKQEAQKTNEQVAELEYMNQLKDRIFSVIANDLRGPIINIAEVLKLLEDKQINKDEFRQYSPSLSKDIIYTSEMLENLLHWSRSQLKGFGLKKEFFNIRSIVTNEVNYYQPLINMKNITLINDVFPNEVGYADIIMMQIIIRNLINNAIKFSNENGEIHITAAYQPKVKQIKLCIADKGLGIDKTRLKKLLNAQDTTTRGTNNEKGSGLGLIICREFMEKNGGRFTASSQLGKGSEFCLWIPIQE